MGIFSIDRTLRSRCGLIGTCRLHSEFAQKCNLGKFGQHIHNISRVHTKCDHFVGYILNVVVFCSVFSTLFRMYPDPLFGHRRVTWQGTLWIRSILGLWLHWTFLARHILNIFSILPTEHIVIAFHQTLKMCPVVWPLGTLESDGWAHSKCTQHVPTGHIWVT